MKQRSIIRILMVAVVISAAVFVVAASTNKRTTINNTEECVREDQDCMEPMTHSEYLLEALTRNLLGR